MRVAVVTLAAGRYAHLQAQETVLAGTRPCPDTRIVVAMGTGEGARCREVCRDTTVIIEIATARHGLPLAAARNAGAARALAAGADLLVFLDVDCLPAPLLVDRYARAALERPMALLCGPVGYLPPRPAGGAAGPTGPPRPHSARPVPPDGAVWPGGDHRLFWTLSFAVTSSAWRRVGGFCEDYVGYGGEDTDFGALARRADVDLCWVGGATAYHQHHGRAGPSEAHVDDILRNAALFRRRWGWWPMRGWLDALADAGLVRYEPADATWRRTGSPSLTAW